MEIQKNYESLTPEELTKFDSLINGQGTGYPNRGVSHHTEVEYNGKRYTISHEAVWMRTYLRHVYNVREKGGQGVYVSFKVDIPQNTKQFSDGIFDERITSDVSKLRDFIEGATLINEVNVNSAPSHSPTSRIHRLSFEPAGILRVDEGLTQRLSIIAQDDESYTREVAELNAIVETLRSFVQSRRCLQIEPEMISRLNRGEFEYVIQEGDADRAEQIVIFQINYYLEQVKLLEGYRNPSGEPKNVVARVKQALGALFRRG